MKLEDLEEMALKGNVNLQYQLGVLYQLGEDVEKDLKKSLKYLKMSAKNGNANAQCRLGYIYCTGDGVERDYKQGLIWFKMASEQRDDIAQGNIGFMYENGYGVEQDYEKAFKYYMMSARNGNTTAQKTVANMYKKGLGTKPNMREYKKWINIIENEKNNFELDDILYNKILIRCKKGDRLLDQARYDEAIENYVEALELIPDPKNVWEASTWVYTALAEAYFQINKCNDAKKYLYDAMNCPNGNDNPFVLLRMGECFYILNNIEKAKEYLIKAYMIEGYSIFENEDEKYFELIKEII